jgi:hypothetical protein
MSIQIQAGGQDQSDRGRLAFLEDESVQPLGEDNRLRQAGDDGPAITPTFVLFCRKQNDDGEHRVPGMFLRHGGRDLVQRGRPTFVDLESVRPLDVWKKMPEGGEDLVANMQGMTTIFTTSCVCALIVV